VLAVRSVNHIEQSASSKLDLSEFKMRQMSEAQHRQMYEETAQQREAADRRKRERQASKTEKGSKKGGRWRSRVSKK
jgi:hypothetical protein